MKLLFVTEHQNRFTRFCKELTKGGGISIAWATCGEDALSMAKNDMPQLMITDETLSDMSGIKLAENMLKVSPMILTAAISTLSAKDFHEASEGLGILGQLPEIPEPSHARDLMEQYRTILAL